MTLHLRKLFMKSQLKNEYQMQPKIKLLGKTTEEHYFLIPKHLTTSHQKNKNKTVIYINIISTCIPTTILRISSHLLYKMMLVTNVFKNS